MIEKIIMNNSKSLHSFKHSPIYILTLFTQKIHRRFMLQRNPGKQNCQHACRFIFAPSFLSRLKFYPAISWGAPV